MQTTIEPYLIQRAKVTSRSKADAKGIDSILEFDYMGSSEFEWGALPNSLKAIRANKEKYDYFKFDYDGVEFTVFCEKGKETEIYNIIVELSKGKHRLKEFCDFEYYFNNPFKNPLKRDRLSTFWWDIDHHYMWWITDKRFKSAFMSVI